MAKIIDITDAEVGSNCDRVVVLTFPQPCKEDAICTVVYDTGKVEKICKNHLRRELNKEIE